MRCQPFPGLTRSQYHDIRDMLEPHQAIRLGTEGTCGPSRSITRTSVGSRAVHWMLEFLQWGAHLQGVVGLAAVSGACMVDKPPLERPSEGVPEMRLPQVCSLHDVPVQTSATNHLVPLSSMHGCSHCSKNQGLSEGGLSPGAWEAVLHGYIDLVLKLS